MESTEAYINQAKKMESEGNYLEAIDLYTEVIEMNPWNTQSLFGRGYIKYAFLDDYIGAITDFDQVIRIEPYHDLAYLTRANSKSCLKDNEGSFSDYSQVISIYESLDPDKCDEEEFHCWLALLCRASLKEESEDYQGAIEDYTFAIKLDPTSERAFSERGKVKCLLKDFKGAVKDFDQAIILDNSIKELHDIRKEAIENCSK